jgi:GrpB-like predicted nucleotidyltransferase (UPF0157 family)
MLGLTRGKVRLQPHCNQWAELYKEEEKALNLLISEYVIEIQHVGSTSIVGLDAKPIIDIAIGIKSLDDMNSIIEILEPNDYIYRGEELPQSFLFVRGIGDNFRTHHIHVIEWRSDYWKDYIIFRDALRENNNYKVQYSQLKHDLASRFPNDRNSYADNKDSFIKQVICITKEKFCDS